MTIKEAVVHVLKTEQRPMKVREIYDKIIEQGLYTFGARNPTNVVRTTIEYACEDSNYAKKDKNLLFKSVINIQGSKEFKLIAEHRCKAAGSNRTNEYIHSEKLEKPNSASQVLVELPDFAGVSMQIAKFGKNSQRTKLVFSGNTYPHKEEIKTLGRSRWNFVDKVWEVDITGLPLEALILAKEESHAENMAEITSTGSTTDVAVTGLYVAEPSLSYKSMDGIIDLDEGISGIRSIIETHFHTLYGYSNIGIVWPAAKNAIPMFLNDNAINSIDDLWEFMYEAFAYEIVMNKPHIWKERPSYSQSYGGLIVNLARQYGGVVSREQIDEYFAKINQNTITNAFILKTSQLLFHSNGKFILTETVNLSDERCNSIKLMLNKIFADSRMSYVVIRDIADEWFSLLPPINEGHPWTALLLQEVLRLKPSIGYNVVYSGLTGQTLDTLGVAIVPEKSSILSFVDVAHDFCKENGLLAKKLLTEQFRQMLRKAGMIDANELIYNLHKALNDHRFAFTNENKMVKILER